MIKQVGDLKVKKKDNYKISVPVFGDVQAFECFVPQDKFGGANISINRKGKIEVLIDDEEPPKMNGIATLIERGIEHIMYDMYLDGTATVEIITSKKKYTIEHATNASASIWEHDDSEVHEIDEYVSMFIEGTITEEDV